MPLFEDWSHPLPTEAIEERIATWEATPRAQILVAEADGELAGAAAIHASPHLARQDWFARLIGLVVSSTHRRQGVGEALVRASEELARGWGVPPARADVDPHAGRSSRFLRGNRLRGPLGASGALQPRALRARPDTGGCTRFPRVYLTFTEQDDAGSW